MTRQSGGAYGWYVVVVLTLGHMVSFLDRAVLITTIGPLKAEFALSDFALGLLFGPSFVILYSVATIPLGRLADRINRKWLIAGGVTIWTVCTLAFGLAHTVTELFAARIGVGLGEAALVPASLSMIASNIPRRQLGRAVGIFLIGPSYGSAAAYFISGILLTDFPDAWRSIFLAATIPGVIVLLLVLTLHEAPREPSPSEEIRPLDKGFLAQHWRAFTLHILASASAIIVLQASFAWMPTYFARTFALNMGLISSVMGTITLFLSPLTAIGAGALLDWFGRKGQAAAPGLVLGASQLLAIPFYLPMSLWTSPITAAATIFGGQILHGFTTSAALTGSQLITPLRLRGTVTAIFMTSITLLGVGLGPPTVGYLSDYWFTDTRGIGVSLTVVIAVFGVLAAVLALLNRRFFAAAFWAAQREDKAEPTWPSSAGLDRLQPSASGGGEEGAWLRRRP